MHCSAIMSPGMNITFQEGTISAHAWYADELVNKAAAAAAGDERMLLRNQANIRDWNLSLRKEEMKTALKFNSGPQFQ